MKLSSRLVVQGFLIFAILAVLSGEKKGAEQLQTVEMVQYVHEGQRRMNVGENHIVVYQPTETVRSDVRAEIIPGLLASIRKATLERREYGKGKPKSRE